MFALFDCNNFYVSCERAFQPHLENKPVVVLSNNDGCIIARSKEAKLLNIPMGAPYFKWQSFCKHHGVYVFSSNYELYGDLSHRVMMLLKQHCDEVEIYSIDEAFLHLSPLHSDNRLALMQQLQLKIKQSLGIPTSIGIGPTKTLAKIANSIAKHEEQTFVFQLGDDEMQNKILKRFPIENVWGIGQRLALKLRKLNIYTALDLRDSNSVRLRNLFSVSLERTIKELQGVSCIPLESVKPRQQIISSRSFSRAVTELAELEEAISHYASIASQKLRRDNLTAAVVVVFLHTNIFSNTQQYDNSACFQFPNPTADTRYIIHVAKACLRKIFKTGFHYHKTGIMLLDLVDRNKRQQDMMEKAEVHAKSEAIMQVVDQVNHTIAKNALFYCAEGIKRDWQLKFSKLSKRYTTRWDELPVVYC